MTDEQIDAQEFAAWLNSQWQGRKLCPICQNNNWALSEKPLELREFHGGGFLVGAPIVPLASATCKVCGYTLLFNAIAAGLLAVEEAGNQSEPGDQTEDS